MGRGRGLGGLNLKTKHKLKAFLARQNELSSRTASWKVTIVVTPSSAAEPWYPAAAASVSKFVRAGDVEVFANGVCLGQLRGRLPGIIVKPARKQDILDRLDRTGKKEGSRHCLVLINHGCDSPAGFVLDHTQANWTVLTAADLTGAGWVDSGCFLLGDHCHGREIWKTLQCPHITAERWTLPFSSLKAREATGSHLTSAFLCAVTSHPSAFAEQLRRGFNDTDTGGKQNFHITLVMRKIASEYNQNNPRLPRPQLLQNSRATVRMRNYQRCARLVVPGMVPEFPPTPEGVDLSIRVAAREELLLKEHRLAEAAPWLVQMFCYRKTATEELRSHFEDRAFGVANMGGYGSQGYGSEEERLNEEAFVLLLKAVRANEKSGNVQVTQQEFDKMPKPLRDMVIDWTVGNAMFTSQNSRGALARALIEETHGADLLRARDGAPWAQAQ